MDDLTAVESSLGLVDKREAALVGLADQIEGNLPSLMRAIADHVASLSAPELALATIAPKRRLRPIYGPWAARQREIAAIRAEAKRRRKRERIVEVASSGNGRSGGLQILSGIGLIGGSIALVSSLIAMATITKTSFFFFTTTAFNWVTLIIGGTVLALLALFGVRRIATGLKTVRTNLTRRLQDMALTSAMGTGRAPGAPSLLTDLQAALLASGQARLNEGR